MLEGVRFSMDWVDNFYFLQNFYVTNSHLNCSEWKVNSLIFVRLPNVSDVSAQAVCFHRYLLCIYLYLSHLIWCPWDDLESYPRDPWWTLSDPRVTPGYPTVTLGDLRWPQLPQVTLGWPQVTLGDPRWPWVTPGWPRVTPGDTQVSPGDARWPMVTQGWPQLTPGDSLMDWLIDLHDLLMTPGDPRVSHVTLGDRLIDWLKTNIRYVSMP